jgi:hypothetical protein
MHAQGHRQQAGQDAELFAQQRPGQRHALAGGEHAAGALGPSDRAERVAGACAAAAIGGGGHGHRSILGAGRPGGPEIRVAARWRADGAARRLTHVLHRPPRRALHGARPPGLVLVREPDELGLERAHPQLALGARLLELAEPTATSRPRTTGRPPVSTATTCMPRVWPGAGTRRSPGSSADELDRPATSAVTPDHPERLTKDEESLRTADRDWRHVSATTRHRRLAVLE